MFAHMAGQPGKALQGKVVGFAGPGGIDDLRRLNAQQGGDLHGGGIDLRLGGGAGLVVGVGVADAAALHGAELLQRPLIHRCIRRIIQIDHRTPQKLQINSIGNIIVRPRPDFKMPGRNAAVNSRKMIATACGFCYTL